MDAITLSRNGILVRLSDERWQHIVVRHADLDGKQTEVLTAISSPARILAGDEGELLALQELEPGKWLVVAYRELIDDGFIITAYPTRRLNSLNRRQQLWP